MDSMNHIVLVEDDRKISEITRMYLEHAGFAVTTAYTLNEAQAELEQTKFCLAVFDVMLPDGNGFDLLKRLRKGDYSQAVNATPIDVPVIMLTALGQTEHVIQGLTFGADDYMSKPFQPAELVARITAILKRTSHASQTTVSTSTLRVADVEIELTSRMVKVRGNEMTLNRREYDLLLFFCRNIQKVYNREQLIAQIWGIEFDGSDRSVDVCVQRVRSKLSKQKTGLEIKTVWGIGYMMEEVKA
jgi:two-component system response regulator ResD